MLGYSHSCVLIRFLCPVFPLLTHWYIDYFLYLAAHTLFHFTLTISFFPLISPTHLHPFKHLRNTVQFSLPICRTYIKKVFFPFCRTIQTQPFLTILLICRSLICSHSSKKLLLSSKTTLLMLLNHAFKRDILGTNKAE